MILEIRTYRLVPGRSAEFLDLVRTRAIPLLGKHGIDVVAYGTSLVSEDGHEEAYLIRAFASVEERQRQEDGFYGSDDWRAGPRDAILALIESYHTIALDVTLSAVEALRAASDRG